MNENIRKFKNQNVMQSLLQGILEGGFVFPKYMEHQRSEATSLKKVYTKIYYRDGRSLGSGERIFWRNFLN